MKKLLIALLLITVALTGCSKVSTDVDIKPSDNNEVDNNDKPGDDNDMIIDIQEEKDSVEVASSYENLKDYYNVAIEDDSTKDIIDALRDYKETSGDFDKYEMSDDYYIGTIEGEENYAIALTELNLYYKNDEESTVQTISLMFIIDRGEVTEVHHQIRPVEEFAKLIEDGYLDGTEYLKDGNFSSWIDK